MSEKNRAIVSLFFNNNEQIFEWTSMSYRTSFIDPLGSFSLETQPTVEHRAKYIENLKKGNLVGIKINGVKQAVLLITTQTINLSDEGVSVSVECKSVLATAYEGCVDPYIAKSYTAATPVSQAVLEALSPYGFETLEADMSSNLSALTGKSLSGQATDVIVDTLKHEEIQASPGEKAYAFCSRIFARLGCVLHVKVNGTLVLAKPDFQQVAAYSLLEGDFSGVGDRILANPGITITDTNDGQFSEVVIVGKQADKRGQKAATAPTTGVKIPEFGRPDSAPFQDVKLEELPSGRHSYWSEGGAAYKPLFIFDKRAKDRDRARNMAYISMGARAANAYKITCSVDGLVAATGAIWTMGTMVRFKSQTLGVDDNFYLLETVKNVSEEGQRTDLTLISPYSLVLGGD